MDVQEYILQLIGYPLPILEQLDADNQHRTDIEPNIGIQVAGLIDLLLRAIQAKKILELGSCIGFSTITLANVAKSTGGNVTSVEFNPKSAAETRTNLQKAGLLEFVTIIEADAAIAIMNLEGPFDFILQDAEKSIYPKLFQRCVELLRPGGILAADDTLFPVMPVSDRYKPAITEYNRLAFNHPDLASTILPIGDGLTISLKLR
jgi:caffeoyl-CoA O-methyltransferase